jgi:hypothetical protein
MHHDVFWSSSIIPFIEASSFALLSRPLLRDDFDLIPQPGSFRELIMDKAAVVLGATGLLANAGAAGQAFWYDRCGGQQGKQEREYHEQARIKAAREVDRAHSQINEDLYHIRR